MRRVGKVQRRSSRNRIQEPLVEPPLTSDGRRNWARMTDTGLVRYTQALVDEKKIPSSSKLFYSDNGLYDALIRRRLLPKLKFPSQKNSWTTKTDEELITYAQTKIDEERIKTKRIFGKKYNRLYRLMLKRKILNSLKFEKGRKWRYYNDPDLIDYAKKTLEDNGIKTKKQLEDFDKGLLSVLRARGLLDELDFVKPKKKPRDWSHMSDPEVVQYAQSYVDRNKLCCISDLQKADLGLYSVLRKRGLRERIEFDKKKKLMRPHGFFSNLSDEELVEYASKFVSEKKLTARKSLAKAGRGLYAVLLKRKLLDKIGLPEKKEQRSWKSTSNGELITYAQRLVDGEGIRNKSGLEKEDPGLYNLLLKKGLIDSIRFIEVRFKWIKMNDEELTAYAKMFLNEKGIGSRFGLQKVYGGLYNVLHHRNLLDQVFAPFEQQKRKQALDEIVEAVRSFK